MNCSLRYAHAFLSVVLTLPAAVLAQEAARPKPDQFLEGETWEWQQTDTRTKIVQRAAIRTIVSANGEIRISDSSRPQASIESTFVDGPYKPSNPSWRVWPLQVGKTWSFDADWVRPDGFSGNTAAECKVVAYEEVTVPAGKFMAFKIEQAGWYRNSSGGHGRQVDIYWYAPEVLADVKHTHDDGVALYTEELVSTKRAAEALKASADSAAASPSASQLVMARTYLSREKISSLFVGKTVQIRRYTDGLTREFSFHPDGTVQMEGSSGKRAVNASGNWEVADRKMCVHLSSFDTCFNLFEENAVVKAGPPNEAARWEVLSIR